VPNSNVPTLQVQYKSSGSPQSSFLSHLAKYQTSPAMWFCKPPLQCGFALLFGIIHYNFALHCVASQYNFVMLCVLITLMTKKIKNGNSEK